MALVKLGDFDPDYTESFDGNDIKGMGVYSETDEKIGTVNDVLVDEQGHFRYFIVDLGFWIFGKKVLLPVGRSRVDHNANRVYAVGMTREQADHLPEFNENLALDYDYEENVRGVYRTPATAASVSTTEYAAPIDTTSYRTPDIRTSVSTTDYATPVDTTTYRTPATGPSVSPVTDAVTPVDTSAPLEASAPLDAAYSTYDEASAPEGAVYPTTAVTPDYTTYNRDTYTYQQEPSLYELNERDHQSLRLYQERLVANKKRVKTGEVAVGKHVETETARVSVPIEKERVVIERVTPADAGQAVAPGSVDFREGEVAHVEIYEETPEIRKEAFVREEVRVTKVVEQDTVNAEETIRREELDVKTEDIPVVDTSTRLPNDRI